MELFVKICGNANAADAEAVAAMKPDAMGFIFWPKSKRAVTAEAVREWTRRIPDTILKVGVFVDSPPEAVAEVVRTAGLTAIQLHGSEDPTLFRDIAPVVWRAIHTSREVPQLAWRVDAYLVDSYSPESPGGTGKTADWPAARALVQSSPVPVLLAGGLSPENIQEAIATVRPWGVDVTSGVEKTPGIKDLDKVREFIARCRAA